MFSSRSGSNSWRSRRNSRREPSGRFSATSRPGSPSGDSNPPTFRRQSSSSPKVAPNPFSGEASHSLASYDDAAQPRGWAGALLARLRGDDAMGSFKRKESKGNLFHERQKARRTVIDPQNPGWVAWEWVVLVIALWNLAALPWYFAFAPDDAVRLLGVDTALDALFLLDMLCRTRLAFPDRRGRLVTEPRVLFANYARGRLVVDLLSFLPLSLLAAAAAPELPARTIAFLGLNRGLRVSRFIGNARLSRLTAQSAIWRMVHLLFLFVLFAHWLGSGFFALSFLHEPSSWGDASLATASAVSAAAGARAEAPLLRKWITEEPHIASASPIAQWMGSFYSGDGYVHHRRLRRHRARVECGEGLLLRRPSLLGDHVRHHLREHVAAHPELRSAATAVPRPARTHPRVCPAVPSCRRRCTGGCNCTRRSCSR